MKKMYLILLVFWSIFQIGSCKTYCEKNYPSVNYELEDFSAVPERVELEKPETVKDLGDMIIYYEEILSEWESFGISVFDTLEIPLPDNLQSIKNYLEKQNEQSPIID